MQAWKQASGWDASRNQKFRLCFGIIGYTLAFCGIAMQWWAAVRLYRVPLKYICRSYSGYDDVMTRKEWATGFSTLGTEVPETISMPLAELTRFAAENVFGYDPGHGGNMANVLHASPSFWCKYLPECPKAPSTGSLKDGFFYFHKAAVCSDGKVLVPGENTRQGGWAGRSVSLRPHWNMNPQYIASSWTDTRISCSDKRGVYRAFLEETAAFNGALDADDIDDAVDAFNRKCHNEKGPIRYAIGLGPTLSAFAFVFGALALCCPSSPYLSGTAKSFLILGLSATFIALWTAAFSVQNELTNFSWCGEEKSPLTGNGTLFDNTPCFDQDSWGQREYNPYFVHTAHIEGMYHSGCIVVIVGLILCMVALWKQSEKRVAQTFQRMSPDDDL